MRILIVDGHTDSAEAVRLLLSFHGVKVAIAGSCWECLMVVATQPFDLILMEHNLSDGDGCGMVLRIARHTLAPIVAMTVLAGPADHARSKAAGFLAHMSKPFDFDRLHMLVVQIQNGDHLRMPEQFARDYPF